MSNNKLSHYTIIANSFSVIEISAPISIADPNDVEALWEKSMEVGPDKSWLCLVRDVNHIYGYLEVYFDDELFEAPLNEKIIPSEKILPITPDQIVPSTMPLLDLPLLFEEHSSFFVLTRNEISHIVCFRDLDKLPMKLCLFALIMELEVKMLRVIETTQGLLEGCLHSLSEERLKKARELCNMKYKKETPGNLLLCTTFIDKQKILRQSSEIRNKLGLESKIKFDQLFNFKRVEEIRNQIAHSDSIIEFLTTPKDFNKFLLSLHETINAMDQLINI